MRQCHHGLRVFLPMAPAPSFTLKAPVSGEYIFWVCSDDGAMVFLSSSLDRSAKVGATAQHLAMEP